MCHEGYDLANQTAYLDDMLRWGLDWLMRVRLVSSYVLALPHDTVNRLTLRITHYMSKSVTVRKFI
jgi:hypothetical protein